MSQSIASTVVAAERKVAELEAFIGWGVERVLSVMAIMRVADDDAVVLSCLFTIAEMGVPFIGIKRPESPIRREIEGVPFVSK